VTGIVIDQERVDRPAANVTDAAGVDALVTGTSGGFGSLDILVNNAGITRDASLKKIDRAGFSMRSSTCICAVPGWAYARPPQ